MIRTGVHVHVCPVAWLKIAKSCPCLSHFHGFFNLLKIRLISKMSRQTLLYSRLTGSFSQFFQGRFQKKMWLFRPKSEGKPESSYGEDTLQTENYVFV